MACCKRKKKNYRRCSTHQAQREKKTGRNEYSKGGQTGAADKKPHSKRILNKSFDNKFKNVLPTSTTTPTNNNKIVTNPATIKTGGGNGGENTNKAKKRSHDHCSTIRRRMNCRMHVLDLYLHVQSVYMCDTHVNTTKATMGRRQKSNWMHSTPRRPFDKMQTEIIGSCNGSNSSDSTNTICATADSVGIRCDGADNAATHARNNNNHHQHKNNNKNSYSGCSSSNNGGAGNNCDFFNFATILFAMFMIFNVQLSSGLIEIQTEKEKHGKSQSHSNIQYSCISKIVPIWFSRSSACH